jgi:beta-lactamase superfamily II metal-dependent hydrolase
MNLNDPMLLQPPDEQELEVSVFGPGVGECIVIHLGGGKWFIVDSCLHNGTPVAKSYLEKLSVPATAVVGILVTHWHDDHCQGAGALFQHYTAARFYCSSALRSSEFLTLISTARSHYDSNSGVAEFHTILETIHQRSMGTRGASGPSWLMEGQRFWNENQTELWALSTSSAALTISKNEIAELIPEYRSPKRRLTASMPNPSSVVLQLKHYQQGVLLGADLEESGNTTTGWSAVLTNHPNVNGQSQLYKVAHHGSPTAHHEGIFSELLSVTPVGVMTPYRRSKLPSETDLQRLSGKCNELHLTAPVSRKSAGREKSVEKTMRDVACNRLMESSDMGMVRIRLTRTGIHSIEHFGAAAKLLVPQACL